MSSYQFRLENVLMVRKIRNSAALADLAKATRTVNEHAEQERLAREIYNAIRMPSRAVSGDEFLAHREHGERLAGELEHASTELASATAERDRRRERVIETDRDVKALERLDERLRDRWLAELARKEALELDDLATASFVRASLERAR